MGQKRRSPVNRPETKTKILLDGGNPQETQHIRSLLGSLDGQTTNPTFVAKNPEVQQRISTGHKLTLPEQKREYKRIVQQISPLVASAGVSIEVFADFDTTAEQMLAQGEEMFSWVPNAYIKYPCLSEGLRAAKMSVERGMRVNMTLCFSQDQAAAVYAATRGAKEPVYVSPFVGRLDDRGDDGMQVVRNIKRMYEAGDGHVHVLVASLRRLQHLHYSFVLGAELVTAPAKILEEWAAARVPLPEPAVRYDAVDQKGRALKQVPYKELDLNGPWESFDLKHELTDKGIERFVADYRSTLAAA
jgi:transaldolase